MTELFRNQIVAIRKLLVSPYQEVKAEAYDSIFALWLKITDSQDFNEAVVSIALEHPNLILEFEQRINDIVKSRQITDIYLRKRLKNLRLDVDIASVTKYHKVLDNPSKSDKTKDEGEMSQDSPKKVFISYAHVDEKLMDRLVSMLKPYERQGIFEIWYDCEILEGDEWFKDIQEAINTCDIALLLISIDFLNSRFIQEEELPRLLQLRLEKGLRVIPIIIRECPWKSVSVLRNLKALPKDGKPVTNFKGSNQPDHVLTEVASRIAELSKLP